MTDEAPPAPPSTPLPDQDQPRRTAPRVVRRVVTSAAMAALAAGCAYLWVVAHQWETRAADLTAISEDLGAEVVAEQDARAEADANAAALQVQLDTATARITDLANEEAAATDNEAVLVNYLDAMIDCADDWVQHASVLKGTYRYTDKTTAQVERELTAYCDGIKAEYATLKAELGR